MKKPLTEREIDKVLHQYVMRVAIPSMKAAKKRVKELFGRKK